MLELDRGEAEAITLALQLGHARVLMDERDGRAKARALGLQPICVLGVLLRAKTDGQVQSVEPIMAALKQDAGFFIADGLYLALLQEAGER